MKRTKQTGLNQTKIFSTIHEDKDREKQLT